MASGKNQWTQLLSAKRRRNKGDLNRLQARLWYALEAIEAGLRHAMEQRDDESARRWINSMGQIAQVYLRVSVEGDLERRIAALEAKYDAS